MKTKIKEILNTLLNKNTYNYIEKLYGKIKINYINIFFKKRQSIYVKSGDFKIVLDPKNGYTDKMLFWENSRDVYITNVLDKYLKQGSVFLDIGMNIGYETLWAAKIVGSSGKIISFEPLNFLVEQVKQSLSINNFNNVTIVNKALGLESGKTKIFLKKEDAGLSSLTNSEDSNTSQEIIISTLDTEVKNLNSLDLIKIDVEGYEHEVLLGGRETIKKFLPTIVFEFTPNVYENQFNGKSFEILNFLLDLNYLLKTEINNLELEINIENVNKFILEHVQKNSILNIIAFRKK